MTEEILPDGPHLGKPETSGRPEAFRVPSKRRITVEESERDYLFVETTIDRTRELCQLVGEMFGEHSGTLLSPVYRRIVREKAATLLKNLQKGPASFHVDNPGITDLVWTEQ